MDVYPADLTISVIALPASATTTDEALRAAVLKALSSIRTISVARLRNRDFPVFICRWNVHGEPLVGIGLPHRFDHRLHLFFQERLRRLAKIVDIGNSTAQDVGATPLARYQHGKLVAYVDPLHPEAHDGIYGADVELRSAESSQAGIRRRRRISPLPEIRDKTPRRHSIDTWQEMRLDVLRFIWETLTPGTFGSLRREISRQFGIRVRSVPTALAGRHGSIATNWMLASDLGCETTIYVNKDLSDQLKYVVLAHELAHYALHFPIILAGQLVEQLAWSNPAYERAYLNLFTDAFHSGQALEDQANILASHLLIPPQYALSEMAKIIYEGPTRVSGDELAWRFLQPFFPEIRARQYSWRNWNEMRQRTQQDIEWARGVNAMDADTLYRAMLKATLERDSAESRELSAQTTRAVFQMWQTLPYALLHAAKDDALVRDQLTPMMLPMMLAVDSIYASRQALEPLMGRSAGAPRLPLVPVAAARASALWHNVLDLSAPPRAVEEWRRCYPMHAITLYPHQRIPHEPVYFAG